MRARITMAVITRYAMIYYKIESVISDLNIKCPGNNFPGHLLKYTLLNLSITSDTQNLPKVSIK